MQYNKIESYCHQNAINKCTIKSKLDGLLHHAMLNDTDMCFISETWIDNDHNLWLHEAKITGPGYKVINKHEENWSGGGAVCMYKRQLYIQTCTEEDIYISLESQTLKLKIKSKLHWISTVYMIAIFQDTSNINIYLHWWISGPSILSSMPNRLPNNNWWNKYSLK